MPQNVSVGRMIDARKIGYVVTFLASPESVAINGDTIAARGRSGMGYPPLKGFDDGRDDQAG